MWRNVQGGMYTVSCKQAMDVGPIDEFHFHLPHTQHLSPPQTVYPSTIGTTHFHPRPTPSPHTYAPVGEVERLRRVAQDGGVEVHEEGADHVLVRLRHPRPQGMVALDNRVPAAPHGGGGRGSHGVGRGVPQIMHPKQALTAP